MIQNLAKTQKSFITGAVLCVLSSIVIGVFNVGVLYLFGIPILTFLAGLVLVWFSKIQFGAKVAATLIPIPVAILSFFVAFQINKAEPETFLIPQDFRGEIVVFYDEPCGKLPVHRNGRRVYEISSDGVIITQFKKNDGYLDRNFCFSDSERSETEIPYFHRQDFETERMEWSSSHSSPLEDFTKETIGAFWNSSETYMASRNSLSFMITNFGYYGRDQKDVWFERKEFAKKAVQLLKQCREDSLNLKF